MGNEWVPWPRIFFAIAEELFMNLFTRPKTNYLNIYGFP
jgi:hypothetical protein